MSTYINFIFNSDSAFSYFLRKYKIHFLVWLIFTLYESLFAGLVSGVFGTLGNYIVHYSINISLFYVSAHFALPLALKNYTQAFWRTPLFIVLLLAGYIVTLYCVDTLLVKYTNILEMPSFALNRNYIIFGTWRGFYFIAFSAGYYFLITFIKEKNRANNLEKEKLVSIIEKQEIQGELIKTQNAFLKAQINPHFLFNILTFIFDTTRKTNPKAAEAVLSLSDMMRYALSYEVMGDEAELTDEIEQVENLIRLHQLKTDNSLHLQLDRDEDLENVKIIPLVLLTLVENMFKHGILGDATQPASIKIKQRGNNLTIETHNKINRFNSLVSHHVGLDNIQKRLELKYKENYEFTFNSDEQNYFHVKIVIKSNDVYFLNTEEFAA